LRFDRYIAGQPKPESHTGPLVRIDPSDIVFGGLSETHIHIDRAPKADDLGEWTMVVEGVELTRTEPKKDMEEL
jgi:hypothetical protein